MSVDSGPAVADAGGRDTPADGDGFGRLDEGAVAGPHIGIEFPCVPEHRLRPQLRQRVLHGADEARVRTRRWCQGA